MSPKTGSEYVLWETFPAQMGFLYVWGNVPGNTTSNIKELTRTCQVVKDKSGDL